MDSNIITNPTECIVKSSKSNNLTNDQLLKLEELRRAEARVKPYIVDILNREYGGTVERTTLRNKIIEILSLNRTTALMRIKRLCFSGRLVEDGNLIKCPECHIVTLSRGVPQCETCDTCDKSN